MNELNGQINLDDLAFMPNRLMSIIKQESSDSFLEYRYKEICAIVNLFSKMIDYIVYIDSVAIVRTDSLLEAIICYNEAK